jgi:hypothetical protein
VRYFDSYFDALTNSSFKTAQDGTKLFFPWGIWGSGYRIASAQEYLRLRRHIKTQIAAGLILIIASGLLVGYVYTFAVAVPLVGYRLLWTLHELSRLKKSDKRFSLHESMTSQALAHNWTVLRLLQASSIVLAVSGGIMLFAGMGNPHIALAAVIFFGTCAVFFSHMAVLRQRADTAASSPPASAQE